MRKLFLLAACLGAGIGAIAAEAPSMIKIDVDGRGASIPFKIISASGKLKGLHPAWIKEPDKRNTYMIFQGSDKLSQEQWVDMEFTFVAEVDGIALLTLRSAMKNAEFWGWTAYRNIELSGAEFSGNWRVSPKMLRKTPEGDIFYAAHDASIVRGLKLTAGQEVKIRFQAQGAPSLEAKTMPITPDPLDTPPPMRAADNMPVDYYRYFDSMVKLLPLKDKGLSGEHIGRHLRDPGRQAGRELPQPRFLATTLAGTPNKPLEFKIPVELLEEAGVARNAAVRFGFPLPKGHFFASDFLRVLDPAGREVPAQFSFLGTWPDSSAKWVLVQFTAPLKANEKAVYHVATGKPAAAKSALTLRRDGDAYLVSTGPLSVKVDGRLFSSVVNNGRELGGLEPLRLVMENGDIAEVLPGKITIEEQGPEVLQFRLDGKLGTVADYVARLRFRNGSAAIYGEISYINTNLEHEFTDFTSLTLNFRTAEAVSAFSVDGDSSLKRYFQGDEQTLNNRPGRMSGVAAVNTAAGNFNIAIRDAALRYPKALAADTNIISLELLPEQPSPDFGKNLPHYLRFPFAGGKYRMKWGMAFTEKFCFDFSGASAAATIAETNLPVIAVIDRDWHFHTAAIQGASAAGDHSFDQYDRQMREAVREHLMFKNQQREFGFLNHGDWFGERVRNWGNNEYDLAHGMFVHFIRTGNRDAARLASAAAQHQADVDIIHAYPDPYYIGANAQHGVGHTGTNYQQVDRGSWTHRYDHSYTAENGHTWSRGMVDEWLLNGNARVMASALKLGEHICWFMAPNFKQLGSHERSGGWSMTALMGLYNGINDPLYLDAAAKIANIAMDEQNFEKGGAWPHILPPAHAGGQKNAYGNCPYLIGVLLEGLGKYHAVTGDPRAEKSIIAGAEWLVKAWSQPEQAWPYGASWDGKPFNNGAPNLNLLIAPAVIYAGNLADSTAMFDIASDVMNSATFRGMDATGKALSLDVATVAGLIDGLSRWNFKHPDRQYKYDNANILKQAFNHESMRFSLRAPDRKTFKIFAKKDNPEISVTRTKSGARPKGKDNGSLAFIAADGKILLREEYPTSAPFSKNYPLPIKAGEPATLEIDDDMTAVWDIGSSPDYSAFALLKSNSSVANANNKGFYFTIPARATEFTLHLRGIHPGNFSARIFDENGEAIESVNGINTGGSRLPWLKYDQAADPVQKRTVRFTPSPEPRNWRLLVSAAGNLSFYFEGIPSAVSIAPGFFPADK